MTSTAKAIGIVRDFIDEAKQTCLYYVAHDLAGLIRDSWAAWWLRCNFDDCLFAAHVIIAKLPLTHPRLVPDRYGRGIGDMCLFNADEIEPWKKRVIAYARYKQQNQWAQFPGYGKWWKYRRSTDYGRYCKCEKLASVGVEIADKKNLKLSLPFIMRERPELFPRLIRLAECEIA